MNAQSTDPHTKALEFFKDWSNYMLVTNTASLGWVASMDADQFWSPVVRALCIIFLAAGIVFGVFTLALIPIIQETRKAGSIYDFDAPLALPGLTECRLRRVCFPQHTFFLVGIILFAVGTIMPDGGFVFILAIDWIVVLIAVLALFGIGCVALQTPPTAPP